MSIYYNFGTFLKISIIVEFSKAFFRDQVYKHCVNIFNPNLLFTKSSAPLIRSLDKQAIFSSCFAPAYSC